jgi:hypothetical protein
VESYGHIYFDIYASLVLSIDWQSKGKKNRIGHRVLSWPLIIYLLLVEPFFIPA